VPTRFIQPGKLASLARAAKKLAHRVRQPGAPLSND
jgi:hypothetical protein